MSDRHVPPGRDPRPVTPTPATARQGLACLSLAMLLSSLGTSSANVALPTLARELGVSFAQVQWVVLAYLLAITVSIVGVGRLGDLVGRRRLLLTGIALFALGSLGAGMLPFHALLVARAVQGIGAAVMMAQSVAFVAATVSPERTGRAMGTLGSLSAVGTALGPAVGGLLIASVGWRAIFLINLPLAAVTFVLARRALPADTGTGATGRDGFDLGGTVLLALALAAYALAMTRPPGPSAAFNLALLAGAALALAAFVAVERRVRTPLIRPALLRDPVLSASLIMSLLVSTVVMATLVVGPFYLTRTLGLASSGVGLSLALGPVVAALTGFPAGRLVDRLGGARMSLAGLLVMSAGAGALSLLPARLGLIAYLAPIAILTMGYALFQAANTTRVMAGRPDGQRGIISGLLNLSRNLGLVSGASALGALFAFAAGPVAVALASPAAVANGMHVTFGAAALLLVAAAGLAQVARDRAVAPAENGVPL